MFYQKTSDYWRGRMWIPRAKINSLVAINCGSYLWFFGGERSLSFTRKHHTLMNAFQWLSLMQPFRKGRNICYIFLLTHFNFLLLNDAWCSEYIMNVILPPLGYLNEKLCSHNWKMEVFKSQLSLFYFASAKAVVNKYLCMCKCFQSLKHYIIYALK